MRKRILLSIFAMAALVSTALMSGCGSSNKEGAAGPLISASRIDNSNCTSTCHAATPSAVTGVEIVADWNLSTHKTASAADCQDCHGGGSLHWGLGPIPFPNPDSSMVCGNCHVNMPPPHFNNITTGSTYPASFVSSQEVGHCRNCHNPHNPTTQMPVNIQWAGSGHGDVNAAPWADREFKTSGTTGANPATSVATDCVRCHTTTGYINYVSSNFLDIHAWGKASDKTKEVLQCNACHDKTYNFDSQRSVGQVTAFYNYSAAAPIGKRLVNVQFPDVKTSNICTACHAGRESGRTIQAIAPFANFSSLSFINSHYLSAGGTIFKTTGFSFYTSAAKYANPGAYVHDQIGLTATAPANLEGTQGPCVGCHMHSTDTGVFDRHTFLPVTKDANGIITTIASPVCNTTACHPGSWTPVTLQGKKDSYNAALQTLAKALKQRGYTFAGGYPYFSNKNWQTNHGATGGWGSAIVPGSGGLPAGSYTMGTAFNFNLLRHDFGGFAHNDFYAKRLIYDSIDWINNGIMDGDVAAAIAALPDDPALKYGLSGETVVFNAATRAAALAYLNGGVRP